MLLSIVFALFIAVAQGRHFPMGQLNTQPAPFIIGGVDVNPPGKWPFMASLWNNSPTGSHFCGASLIDYSWVVTASHCVDGQNPGGIVVLLGAHDFDNANIGEPVFYTVNAIIMHENYNPFSLDNDIALILLDDIVSLNEFVQIVQMAEPADGDFAFTDCFIIGWGGDRYPGGSSYPSILQEAEVPATSNANCAPYYPGSINAGHICVGIPNQAGSCYGDSGGPLVCPDDSGFYVLAGATSFGPEYCPPTSPSVYSRISYFRTWIRINSGV